MMPCSPPPVLSAETYVIPLDAGRYLVYAALREFAFIGNVRAVNFLAALKDGNYDAAVDRDDSMSEFFAVWKCSTQAGSSRRKSHFPDRHAPIALTLFLATACDLRCTYCYAAAGDDAPARFMPLETAMRGIDSITQNVVKHRT